MANMTEADKKLFKASLDVLSEHMRTIEDERGMIKDAIDELADQFSLEKKTIRKIAKAYHRQSFNEEKKSFEDFEDLYEQVTEI